MDTFLIVLAGILIVSGLIGCIKDKLPGTPLSYIGIIILQYSSIAEFTVHFFIKWGVIVIAVQGLDYFIPNWGKRRFGGSKKGVWGSMLGMFAGMYFGPWGIIIGAILGALIGELYAGKESDYAINQALSSFSFFILGTISQIIVAGILLYHYIDNLIYVI
jgi:uncharacterized protein YqgC (DUF456 family)